MLYVRLRVSFDRAGAPLWCLAASAETAWSTRGDNMLFRQIPKSHVQEMNHLWSFVHGGTQRTMHNHIAHHKTTHDTQHNTTTHKHRLPFECPAFDQVPLHDRR